MQASGGGRKQPATAIMNDGQTMHIVVLEAKHLHGSYEEAWKRLRKTYGPGNMPKPLVERLSRELLTSLKRPDVREKIETQVIELNPMSPDAIGALAKEQTDVWRRLARDAGIVPE